MLMIMNNKGLEDWIEETFMPYGEFGLFFVAFFSSTFLPIPPDIMLVLLCMNAPGDPICIWYAALCTSGSVMGGIFGYYLGHTRGRSLMERFITEDKILRVQCTYNKYGMWAIGIAGFTPVPYNIFTLSSGLLKYDVKKFIFMSIVSRGARFFIVAILIMIWGRAMYDLLKDNVNLMIIATTIILAVLYLFRNRMTHTPMKNENGNGDITNDSQT